MWTSANGSEEEEDPLALEKVHAVEYKQGRRINSPPVSGEKGNNLPLFAVSIGRTLHLNVLNLLGYLCVHLGADALIDHDPLPLVGVSGR